MKAVIRLHLKENIKKNSFIAFGIIGVLLTVLLLFNMEFSYNGVTATTDYAVYGFQWTIIAAVASMVGVVLSSVAIGKHREERRSELLRTHGLSMDRQYQSIILGNVIVSCAMGLLLLTGMVIQVIIKNADITFINMVSAILIYWIAIASISILISLLSLLIPAAFSALLGIFIIIVGLFRGTFLLYVRNRGGIFGDVMSFLLQVFPPLDDFNQLTRDIFMGELLDIHRLLGVLIYVWIIIAIVFIATKVVGKHEA